VSTILLAIDQLTSESNSNTNCVYVLGRRHIANQQVKVKYSQVRIYFSIFELEIIENHNVFKHLSLKSLTSIVCFNIWAWNHWKALCFSTFEPDSIEQHYVFKRLSLKSLKGIIFVHQLSLTSLKTLCVSSMWAWQHWKACCFSAFELANQQTLNARMRYHDKTMHLSTKYTLLVTGAQQINTFINKHQAN
jgi:hypothetical protein